MRPKDRRPTPTAELSDLDLACVAVSGDVINAKGHEYERRRAAGMWGQRRTTPTGPITPRRH
jgi:hypothetical protein